MPNIPSAALWKGPPTLERQRELSEEYFCDAFNQRGLGHGVLFKLRGGKWRYFDPPFAFAATAASSRD